jgi:phosphoribosyl 1,2-cyclic phosphodiesterase
MNFYEALAAASELEAKHVYLTHLSHELDPAQAQSELPDNTCFAHDGLKLTFPVDVTG